ncbi:cytochrome P450 6k1-like isoform X2 [Pieris napi]|uniref:cytochrome P450 6k1-like isoform X2 n=1 Tax=Pieris napi TaxID=78633 RepID=UPI001FBB1484|nr:cytochrome P450 6k1-like isoform X2 [Pieris napi]
MDLLSFFLASVLLFLITILVYIYCYNRLNYWRRKGVPQLTDTDKIFGDFKRGILFRSPPGYHFGELYHRMPKDVPYVGFYIFHKPCLLLRDPEIIKQILVKDFHNFSNRHFSGSQQRDSSGMRNLFGLVNPGWRYLRRKISPTFTRKNLKHMLTLMIDAGKPMMEFLNKNINDKEKKIIDAQDINYRYTADLIANVALGFKADSFNCPESDYTKYFMDFFHSFKRMIAVFIVFFVPELVTVVGPRVLYDATFVQNIFWKVFESREKSGNKRGDIIDTLIELKNSTQDPVYKFEGDNLFAQSSTFFSGFQTSSHVCAFTLMELAKSKECQDRARDCIKEAVAKYGWTLEGFNEMKYMEQVISEGVRMHPSVPILDRYTLDDYKIPNTDLTIEKGTPIYISLYGLHRDSEFFENPDVFDPDRFSKEKKMHENYLPFGTGPRKCVGMKAGRLFVKVVISMILSEYEVYLQPSEKINLDKRATFTTAENGINMTFTKI